MGLGVPPRIINDLFESNPLKSRFLVCGLTLRGRRREDDRPPLVRRGRCFLCVLDASHAKERARLHSGCIPDEKEPPTCCPWHRAPPKVRRRARAGEKRAPGLEPAVPGRSVLEQRRAANAKPMHACSRSHEHTYQQVLSADSMLSSISPPHRIQTTMPTTRHTQKLLCNHMPVHLAASAARRSHCLGWAAREARARIRFARQGLRTLRRGLGTVSCTLRATKYQLLWLCL